MRHIFRYPYLFAFAATIGVLGFVFAWPLLDAIPHGSIGRILFRGGSDGWLFPFARSSAFAFASTIITVPLGFVGAMCLKNCNRPLGYVLAILMLPILAGGVAAAFCIKVDLMHASAFESLLGNRDLVPTWGFMLLVQAWQLLTLSTYIFWLRLQQVPATMLQFGSASGLTRFERVRDIYWPHTRNLAGMLALFATVTSYYEFIKFYLILRASPGSGTELVSHWLLRLYDFYSSVDPRVAVTQCLAMSAVAVVAASITVLCTVVVVLTGVDIGVRALARWPAEHGSGNKGMFANLGAVLCVALTVGPFVGLVPYMTLSDFVPWSDFSFAVILALAAAIVTVCVSVVFGIALRLMLRNTLERFDSRSVFLFAGLYLVQVIPGIAIALCGYFWLGVLARHSSVGTWVPALWLACEIIVTLPLTTSFVLVSHFRVSTNEIEFQESASTGLSAILEYSFIRRFSLDYLLTLLFGLSVIWTESTINSTISDLSQAIPSVSVELAQRVDGRGASYSQAANLILVTLIPMLAGIALWSYNARRLSSLASIASDSTAYGRVGA